MERFGREAPWAFAHIRIHDLKHNSESRIIPSYLLVAVQADEFPRVVRAPIA
jgi:hypothetical protein